MKGKTTLNRSHTRVILARHGETVFNRNRIIMGRADSDLTEDGIRIAMDVAGLIADEHIDAAFASPLPRAFRSARLYTKDKGLSIETQDSMAELACGEWEGVSKLDVKPDPRLIRESWDDRPPGGESYRDAENRVSLFIDKIRQDMTYDHILVVGHAGVNRVFLRLWLELKPEDAIRIRCPHDTIFILDSEPRVRTRSVSGHTTEDLLIDPA
jgi:broad specificity phosphatase PhoE